MTSVFVHPSSNHLVEVLVHRPWLFGIANRVLISPYLVFHRDGQIGGIDDARFRKWTLDDDSVIFRDESGSRTMAFRVCELGTNARVALAECNTNINMAHFLLETESLLVYPQKEDSSVLTPLPKRRPNLVVLRAGKSSMHTSWLKDITDTERNWDLCISWYDDAESFSQYAAGEYNVLQNELKKFQSIHKLLYSGGALREYDYVAFPDDDIDTSWRDINLMFEIAKCHKLMLCQPALHRSSFYSHQITLQQSDKRLRYTNFVEVMFPVFSQAALERCVGSFPLSESSWGLDQLWPRLLGGHRYQIGVIDAVAVRHTRPVGGSYDQTKAFADKYRLMHQFSAPEDYQEFGFIVI